MFDSVVLADSAGEGFATFAVVAGLIILGVQKLYRKFDNDSTVKRTAHEAAKKGAIGLIQKCLRK